MSSCWRIGLALVGCLAPMGCLAPPPIVGSGVIVGESYDLTDFSRLSIHAAMDVTVLQGEGFAVEVSADDNVIDLIKIEQHEDQLRIGFARSVRLEGATIVCVVHVPELTEAITQGASQLHLNSLTARKLKLVVEGASRVDGEVMGGDISLSMSGASRAELAGHVQTLTATVEGASDARLGDLTVLQTASVDSHGASRAKVHVSGELSMAASGASHISFLGEPQITRSETSGASSIGPE